MSQEEQNLHNIIEEECECCTNVRTNDTEFDDLKSLDHLKMI